MDDVWIKSPFPLVLLSQNLVLTISQLRLVQDLHGTANYRWRL